MTEELKPLEYGCGCAQGLPRCDYCNQRKSEIERIAKIAYYARDPAIKMPAPVPWEETDEFLKGYFLRIASAVIAAWNTRTPDTSAKVDVDYGDYYALRDFFENVWDRYCDLSLDLEEAESIRITALRLGLIRKEDYDLAKHGHDYSERLDFEQGDPIYFANKPNPPFVTSLQAPCSDTSADMYTNSSVSIHIEETCIQTSAVELVKELCGDLRHANKYIEPTERNTDTLTKAEQWLKKMGEYDENS